MKLEVFCESPSSKNVEDDETGQEEKLDGKDDLKVKGSREKKKPKREKPEKTNYRTVLVGENGEIINNNYCLNSFLFRVF